MFLNSETFPVKSGAKQAGTSSAIASCVILECHMMSHAPRCKAFQSQNMARVGVSHATRHVQASHKHT